MAILFLYQVSFPEVSIFAPSAANFGLAYFSLATTLNTLLTMLICGKLLLEQRRLKRTQGIHPNASSNIPYKSIISIFVESSALYSVTSLIFIGTYAANNVVSGIFLTILSQIQVCLTLLRLGLTETLDQQIIAPLLIIYRVAKRKAWTSEDTLQASKLCSAAVTGSCTSDKQGSELQVSPNFSTASDSYPAFKEVERSV